MSRTKDNRLQIIKYMPFKKEKKLKSYFDNLEENIKQIKKELLIS